MDAEGEQKKRRGSLMYNLSVLWAGAGRGVRRRDGWAEKKKKKKTGSRRGERESSAVTFPPLSSIAVPNTVNPPVLAGEGGHINGSYMCFASLCTRNEQSLKSRA